MKKGFALTPTMLVMLIMVLVSGILITTFVLRVPKALCNGDVQACRTSVWASHKAEKLGFDVPSSCPGKTIQFKRESPEEVNEVISNELEKCIFKFHEGRLDFSDENFFKSDWGDKVVCFRCADFDFRDYRNKDEYVFSKFNQVSNPQVYMELDGLGSYAVYESLGTDAWYINDHTWRIKEEIRMTESVSALGTAYFPVKRTISRYRKSQKIGNLAEWFARQQPSTLEKKPLVYIERGDGFYYKYAGDNKWLLDGKGVARATTESLSELGTAYLAVIEETDTYDAGNEIGNLVEWFKGKEKAVSEAKSEAEKLKAQRLVTNQLVYIETGVLSFSVYEHIGNGKWELKVEDSPDHPQGFWQTRDVAALGTVYFAVTETDNTFVKGEKIDDLVAWLVESEKEYQEYKQGKVKNTLLSYQQNHDTICSTPRQKLSDYFKSVRDATSAGERYMYIQDLNEIDLQEDERFVLFMSMWKGGIRSFVDKRIEVNRETALSQEMIDKLEKYWSLKGYSYGTETRVASSINLIPSTSPTLQECELFFQ